ncbi:MAG: HD domain-containing protein [Flavobacteriales bacterium]|tara:strand:- start:42301 stop:43533 length:1233 start_codon:yes stop_codon:yes gene_type:complete
MNTSSKILNDPIHGFIRLPKGIIFDLIEHPYFQRLRRISQLGLSSLVYPGAYHTRFHHAIGAMHLMTKAIESLRSKGHEITEEESLGAEIAILLHDIGHGPFSHALEHSISHNISHEQISSLFMKKLNKEFDGKLDLAIQIFEGNYKKNFLHQLVSSQLDVDRMDYLKRDSFYSGVQEGTIGAERIIHMLNIVDDNLVVESKGIYSVEKFLIARRLMYWQVYFHKTVVCAEQMLIQILKRAKELSQKRIELFTTTALKEFLENNYTLKDFEDKQLVFNAFTQLDDFDIMTCIKQWKDHKDIILSTLSNNIIDRKLFKVIVNDKPFNAEEVNSIKEQVKIKYSLNSSDLDYMVIEGQISNDAYKLNDSDIKISFKDGSLLDISQASDQDAISAISKKVKKFFICYPKDFKN